MGPRLNPGLNDVAPPKDVVPPNGFPKDGAPKDDGPAKEFPPKLKLALEVLHTKLCPSLVKGWYPTPPPNCCDILPLVDFFSGDLILRRN